MRCPTSSTVGLERHRGVMVERLSPNLCTSTYSVTRLGEWGVELSLGAENNRACSVSVNPK
jgi:hypothetical protein